MSYEKVRNINYKTREITSASNNTYVWNGNKYVHDYITWKYGVDSWSEKEFISNLLMDISNGNLQCGSKYKKLYILIDKANIKELDDIRWNWDKKYSDDERHRAKAELKDRLYNTYKNYRFTKGQYFIQSSDNIFVHKITKTKCIFSNKDKAKVYDTLEEAEFDSNILKKYFNNCEDVKVIDKVELEEKIKYQNELDDFIKKYAKYDRDTNEFMFILYEIDEGKEHITDGDGEFEYDYCSPIYTMSKEKAEEYFDNYLDKNTDFNFDGKSYDRALVYERKMYADNYEALVKVLKEVFPLLKNGKFIDDYEYRDSFLYKLNTGGEYLYDSRDTLEDYLKAKGIDLMSVYEKSKENLDERGM